MKTRILTTLGMLGALALTSAQTIPNPSFEANSFTNWPGYISTNTQIVGWTTGNPGRAGLNPVSGGNPPNPFADNGAIPDGANVAFIQSGTNSSLSAVISNLTVGQTYKVNFQVNARAYTTNPPPFTPVANLKVDVAGANVIYTVITNVGIAGNHNPAYPYFAFDFTATDVTNTLTLRNDATNSDNTVLLDNFSIAPRNSGWSYADWLDDASSGVVVSPTNYTHAYRFGDSAIAKINGVNFIGIGAGNPSSSSNGVFTTTGLPTVSSIDSNNVTGASSLLAQRFVYGGSPEGLTLNGLVVGKSYVTTIYSVGYETNGARAATFSVGDDRLTVNQDYFGNDNGIRVSYAYTADSSRSITLTYVPLQGPGHSFYTYGFSNYELSNSHAAFLIVTNLGDSGPGTLRQAIADSDPGDTITFAVNGTITLSNSPLFITKSLNITGPGPFSLAVDGNSSTRVFELESGLSASILGLTIQNGGYPNGGGLGNFGTMVLSNCVITRNGANGPSGFGGAIHNGPSGVLSLFACTVSYNGAGLGAVGGVGQDGTLTHPNGYTGGTGATGGNGGGIYNEGVLVLTACTIFNNSAGLGGQGGQGGNGWYFDGTYLGDGGQGGTGGVGGAGGGVFNSASGTLSLTNCTIYYNFAGEGGSGDWGGNGFINGSFGVDGNGGDGGGIYNESSASGLLLTACTVTFDQPGSVGSFGSCCPSLGTGGGIKNAGLLVLTNTIVATNYGGDIDGSYSGSNNLISGDPYLAPLGYYGGPTQTMPPLLGSPAIDAGLDSVTNLLVTDQRGFPRLSGAHVDIGAVEAQAVSAASAPLLKGVAIQSGAFSFSFTNLSVADFTVLASTNAGLPSSQWGILGAAAQIAPGQYHFTDSTAPNYPRRFYRVVSP